MATLTHLLTGLSDSLDWLEHKTKSFFVVVAMLLYAGSLFLLAQKVSPLSDLDTFLVKALGNLSIPFGVILLQELLELLTAIPRSTLRSTCQQFEIVALVILRSFFKDFYKLNKAVTAGLFDEPVQKALVKVAAIVLITVLIAVFRRLAERAGIERHQAARPRVNLLKQATVVGLCLGVLAYMLIGQRSFDIMTFMSISFTGMIVLDAVFFLGAILNSHEFDSLMFNGGLVVSLIFARFPLFAANMLSYTLAVVGVAFATAALRLFVRPVELEFLGDPPEDEVARFDLSISNRPEALAALQERSETFLRQLGVADPIAKKVRLSLDELIGNIMTYAHHDKRAQEIEVGLALHGKCLAVTVSDSGKPFNPFRSRMPDTQAALEQRTVGGLGIYLVRNVMDRVSYRRQAGRNVVTLLKRLPSDGGQGDSP